LSIDKKTKTRKRVRKMAATVGAVTIPVSLLKERVQEEIDKLKAIDVQKAAEHKEAVAKYKKYEADHKSWVKKVVAEVSKNTDTVLRSVDKASAFETRTANYTAVMRLKLSDTLLASMPDMVSKPLDKPSVTDKTFYERKLNLLESVIEETITVRLNDKEWGIFL